jgi:hypothetical protein
LRRSSGLKELAPVYLILILAQPRRLKECFHFELDQQLEFQVDREEADHVPGWTFVEAGSVETWRSTRATRFSHFDLLQAAQIKDFFASDHDSDNSSFNSPVASILTMVSIT